DFALKLALELDRTLENSLDSAHYLESNTTIIHDHNSSSNYKSASNDDNQLGVASPKSYEQSTSLYFNSNTNNDNARARALNNARERALSRTRARATSSTRARALINARLRAFDVAQNLEPSITNCAHTPIPNYDDESNNDNDR